MKSFTSDIIMILPILKQIIKTLAELRVSGTQSSRGGCGEGGRNHQFCRPRLGQSMVEKSLQV